MKQTSITDFIPVEKIGQGSFSSVYRVKRTNDDQTYALKKVKIGGLKEKQKQNALNEIRILASLDSQHIISYKQAFYDERLNLLCIVMEHAKQGDLQKMIQMTKNEKKKISERQIWKASLNMVQGLAVLHTKGILHRDMKSANIFISDGIYKLGDLNVSKVQNSCHELAYTQTGTPYYASPQVWRDQPYDHKSDIWSLGCIVYQMCQLKSPFRAKNLENLYKSVQKGIYQPINLNYSSDLSVFISICLKKNARNRFSAIDLLKSNSILFKKCKQLNLISQNRIEQFQIFKDMLKTIKLPINFKELQKQLPHSRYQGKSKNKRDKQYLGIKNKSQNNISKQKSRSSQQICYKMITSPALQTNNPITHNHDKQGSRRYSVSRNRLIMNNIYSLKKLSQQVKKNCLSQRNPQIIEQKKKTNQEYITDRTKKNHIDYNSLAQIEQKINRRRKQLKKIGSINNLSKKNIKQISNYDHLEEKSQKISSVGNESKQIKINYYQGKKQNSMKYKINKMNSIPCIHRSMVDDVHHLKNVLQGLKNKVYKIGGQPTNNISLRKI